MKPRSDVPCRQDYYLGLAYAIAKKSKDPHTQVGALIVSNNNTPLGWGYNGPCKTADDDSLDWSRPNKYTFMRHAERNAIDHSQHTLLHGATLYVTGPPCVDCMQRMRLAGICSCVYYQGQHEEGSMLNKITDAALTAACQFGIKLIKTTEIPEWIRNMT